MTGREIVKRNIYFTRPPRIAYNFDCYDVPLDETYGDDMMWVGLTDKPLTDGKNEWGVEYVTLNGESFGEPKSYPLQGKDSLGDYAFPDYLEEWRYEGLKKSIAQNHDDKYVLMILPVGIFQPFIDFFGFEDFMINMGENTLLIEQVADKLCEFDMDIVTKATAYGVQGIITMDDAGLQDRYMISMEMFREVFKPRFKRLYDHCRSLSVDTFIHTCGYTLDILDELIDAGCQVINLDQQDNMGIEELSRRYRGKVCFYCPIDIQRSVHETPERIEQRVKQMIDLFSTEKGGFIAKTYPQPKAVGMTGEYLKLVTDAFKKYGNLEGQARHYFYF